MTAATALDLVNADISKWARVLDNAKKIKASRMVAKAERRLAKLEQIRSEWIAHPALSCTIAPDAGGFLVRDASGQKVLRRPSLRSAEGAAVSWGFRNLDVCACGVFA